MMTLGFTMLIIGIIGMIVSVVAGSIIISRDNKLIKKAGSMDVIVKSSDELTSKIDSKVQFMSTEENKSNK